MGKDHIVITCLGNIAPIDWAEYSLVKNVCYYKEYFNRIFYKSDFILGNLEVPITYASQKREDKKYIFNLINS